VKSPHLPELEFDQLVKDAGGLKALADQLGASPQALIHWRARGVPANKCKAFHAATGVSLQRLRPDWRDYWPELRA
jgi:DNA-binding transcriptional regulator YdaS (Cro superfamily)